MVKTYLNHSRAILSKKTGVACVYASQMYAVAKDGTARPTSRVKIQTIADLRKDVAHYGAEPADYQLRYVPA